MLTSTFVWESILAWERLAWWTVKEENWPNMNFEGNSEAKQNDENLWCSNRAYIETGKLFYLF